MSDFRDFDAELQEATGDPIRFKLGGKVFTCVHPAPVGSLVVLARHLGGSDQDQMQGVAKLLYGWIEPAQHADWEEVLMRLSDVTVLEKVVEHLIQEATKRPLSEQSSSPASSVATGPSLTAT